MLDGLPEGTPVLCKRCGAPARLAPHASASIPGTSAIWVCCDHCGNLDELPADSLGRVLEIKNRLALAASRAMQAGSMDRALAHVFEGRYTWLKLVSPYAIALLGSAASSISALMNPSNLPLAAIVTSLTPLLFAGAGGVALWLALLRGRWLFRARIRPHLLAKPPMYEGAPLSCRACGGPLPQSRDVEIACPFCRTSNLVPHSWHGAQASALAREAEQYRASVHTASARSMHLGQSVTRTFVVAFAILMGAVYLMMGIVARW